MSVLAAATLTLEEGGVAVLRVAADDAAREIATTEGIRQLAPAPPAKRAER